MTNPKAKNKTTTKNSHQRSYDIRVIRIATSVMAGLLVGIAVVIFWRRHIGAFQTPLSTVRFLLVGLAIIGPTILLRHWWLHATRPYAQSIPTIEAVWNLYTPTISLLTILVTISVPGTSPLGILLVGAFFLAGEMTIYRPRKPSGASKTVSYKTACNESHDLDALSEQIDSDTGLSTNLSCETKTQPEESVSQQLTRCRTEDGRDCLRGWLRVDIPAGLRTQNVHLAFCPAFEHPPKIEIHPEGDGPKNRIKTVQCLPYGAHLEIKLSRPSPTDETLTLRFQAVGE